MHLMHLPLELLHEILGRAIQVRSIRRGLRLRLVSKFFAREVLTTLPLFRLLDSFFQPVPYGEENPGVCSAAAGYLERRVLHERPGGSSILLRIREVATRLCQEGSDQRNEYDYISLLCPLALSIDTFRANLDKIWAADDVASGSRNDFCGNDLDTDVYIAAMHTKTWPVVTRRILTGKELLAYSQIFGDPYCHAAESASLEVLAAMMDLRHEHDFQILRSSLLGRAAGCGRAEATKFIFNFQAVQRPWACTRKRLRPTYRFDNDQRLKLLGTPSKEIFDFIAGKRKIHCPYRTFGAKENTMFLLRCAERGWAEMAAHYLALGASVDGPEPSYQKEPVPILVACSKGHVEVVRVLLAHGASTSRPALEIAVRSGHIAIVCLLLDHDAELGDAMFEAVARGCRSTVRVILDHRADAGKGLRDLLVHAVELEDKELFQLLVQNSDPAVDKTVLTECMGAARQKGLESMMEMVASMQRRYKLSGITED